MENSFYDFMNAFNKNAVSKYTYACNVYDLAKDIICNPSLHGFLSLSDKAKEYIAKTIEIDFFTTIIAQTFKLMLEYPNAIDIYDNIDFTFPLIEEAIEELFNGDYTYLRELARNLRDWTPNETFVIENGASKLNFSFYVTIRKYGEAENALFSTLAAWAQLFLNAILLKQQSCN